MSGAYIPSLEEPREEFYSAMVCIPVAGFGTEYVQNLSNMLAPKGPPNVELVSTYTRLYRIMTKHHFLDTIRVIFSLRDRSSSAIVMAMHGQAMRYGYTQNPHNPRPDLRQFISSITPMTGAVMEWELGVIAYTQGLSIQQTVEMFERYRGLRASRRKLSMTV
jgi:hypothetical protein